MKPPEKNVPVLAWHDAKEAALGRLATAAGPTDVIVMDIEALTMLVSADLMSRIAGLSDQIRIVIPDAVWSALAAAGSASTARRLVDVSHELFPQLTLAPTFMNMRQRWLVEMGVDQRTACEGMTRAAAAEVVEHYQSHGPDRDIILVLGDEAFGKTALLLPERVFALPVADLAAVLDARSGS